MYELAVLKKYAEPLLEQVPRGSEQYSEAVRILKFIKFFDTVKDEGSIPNNSIMREFIGGSIFAD